MPLPCVHPQAVAGVQRELETAYERLAKAEAVAAEARASAGRSATLALEMGRLQEDNALLVARLDQMAADAKCVASSPCHDLAVCLHPAPFVHALSLHACDLHSLSCLYLLWSMPMLCFAAAAHAASSQLVHAVRPSWAVLLTFSTCCAAQGAAWQQRAWAWAQQPPSKDPVPSASEAGAGGAAT
jgi:hypothetical protein